MNLKIQKYHNSSNDFEKKMSLDAETQTAIQNLCLKTFLRDLDKFEKN